MFEELGWRIERFYINVFEPGGPQRENACGLFIPGIVRAACKMKRATGFPRRDRFCRRESPPKASPRSGRP